MRIDKLLALTGNDLLHTLDVLDSHLVARVGNARMTVFLFVQQCQLSFLIGEENHLVVDDSLRTGNTVDSCEQIDRHIRIVHLDVRIWTDKRGQAYAVHIHKAVNLAATVAHGDRFVIRLEVRHRNDLVLEVHCKIAIYILRGFAFGEKPRRNAGIVKLVMNLAHLYQKLAPLLAVVGEEPSFLALLRDSQIVYFSAGLGLKYKRWSFSAGVRGNATDNYGVSYGFPYSSYSYGTSETNIYGFLKVGFTF